VRLTAREIARIVSGELSGNPDEVVTGVAGIKEARRGDVTFLAHPRYAAAIKTTRASVILVAPNTRSDGRRTLIRVDNPSAAFVKVVAQLAPPPLAVAPGIHPQAIVAPSARLGRDVTVEALAVVQDDVVMGDRVVIGAGSYIGDASQLGNDCRLYPHVTVRERTCLGERVIIHSGVVIGADGFGYNTTNGKHEKIPQVGNVEIGDDVEIGANTTVDRGRFGHTRIGRGTKIDNLVQIGHNCVVGEDCIVCGQVGMAGSTIVGDRVTIAGQVGIAGHLTIGDGATIMAQAGVTKNVPAGAMMLGMPAVQHTEFKRTRAAVQRLPDLAAKIRELEQQLSELRSRLDSPVR
jgi:UDP-3-O-[3-hydroxymyristoyl] glucosamine N-acyltransferase